MVSVRPIGPDRGRRRVSPARSVILQALRRDRRAGPSHGAVERDGTRVPCQRRIAPQFLDPTAEAPHGPIGRTVAVLEPGLGPIAVAAEAATRVWPLPE